MPSLSTLTSINQGRYCTTTKFMCVYIQYQSLLDKHAGRLAAQLPRDSMFACWFQSGLIRQLTVFSFHGKPASAGIIRLEINEQPVEWNRLGQEFGCSARHHQGVVWTRDHTYYSRLWFFFNKEALIQNHVKKERGKGQVCFSAKRIWPKQARVCCCCGVWWWDGWWAAAATWTWWCNVHQDLGGGGVGLWMKTDITHIIFIFIFLFAFGFGHG